MAHYRDQLTTENTQNGAANAASGEEDYFSSLQEKYSSFPVVIFTLEFFRQGRNKCPCQQKHGPSGLVSQWPHSTGQSWRDVSVWNVHSRTILEHVLDVLTFTVVLWVGVALIVMVHGWATRHICRANTNLWPSVMDACKLFQNLNA